MTDAQWEWSAQGGERKLEHATESGNLVGPDGKKLAHCSVETRERTTIDVNDPRYADGPFGLRHKTGEVWEWVERNPNEKYQYSLRGGSWGYGIPGFLRVVYRLNNVGFRVGAPAPQHSLSGSYNLQTRVLDFTESRSVFEGVQINHPVQPSMSILMEGCAKSAVPHLSLVIRD